jgi:hypothetical protein
MRGFPALLAVVAVVSLAPAAPGRADAFVPCRYNRPGDAGLRVLVQAAIDNQPNTLAVQKLLGLPQTPVHATADQVDLVAWCRCVHQRWVRELGRDLAEAVGSLDSIGTYRAWLDRLTPEQQRQHVAFTFTAEARCIDDSRK